MSLKVKLWKLDLNVVYIQDRDKKYRLAELFGCVHVVGNDILAKKVKIIN